MRCTHECPTIPPQQEATGTKPPYRQAQSIRSTAMGSAQGLLLVCHEALGVPGLSTAGAQGKHCTAVCFNRALLLRGEHRTADCARQAFKACGTWGWQKKCLLLCILSGSRTAPFAGRWLQSLELRQHPAFS